MTVQELIEELKKMPQGYDVFLTIDIKDNGFMHSRHDVAVCGVSYGKLHGSNSSNVASIECFDLNVDFDCDCEEL